MALVEKTNKPLKKAASSKGAAAPTAIVDDDDDIFAVKENVGDEAVPKRKTPKKKTVEETYQKLTQLEHVLLRPDTYIGSTEMNRTKLWVFDQDVGMTQRDVTYVPGLYKIFDEILVNAADNKQRDKSMDTLKVNIDPESNTITVWNNGGGIPVQMHNTEKCWLPELIFGHLLTSSNYNDTEKKTTGGRNGYGAKLANIFSTEFTVETADGSRSGKKYKQTWNDNMQTKGSPKIKDCKSSDNWTCISFKPDLAKFGMACLDADAVGLFKKRVYDMAGVTPGVKVFLDDERIKIKNFEEYCGLYLKAAGSQSESGEPPRSVHIKSGERWEIVVAVSDGQFQQVSFVNSIATTRGGSHVNHVSDQLAQMYLDYLAKKHKGLKLKPFQVKSHIWVFINSLIENPAFDSQTKETLTLKPSAFGSKAEFDDKFFKKMMAGTSILDSILSFGQEKQNKDMKKTDGKKTGRITGIPKLEDANDAGTKNALDCTLILTEGDSAKALAVSGLAVVGRNRYGVFPLRGKVANPRDANHEQIMKNEEIKNLKTILGLQQTNKYEGGPSGLRYGHVMIMADQDPDGSHIKGLLINLFHYYWPNLLKHPGFLQEFATPIVKAKKKNGKSEIPFFTLQEYEDWRQQTGDGLPGWSIKYYKGLGTSSSQEAKEYFSNLPLHVMDFSWEGAESGEVIEMVFSKKRADDRKQWLLKYESDLYVDHNQAAVSYSDFVNKELIHFSMMDNMRSIPSLVDGLKPGQRKILFACFKRKLKAEIKVAQLAGYVAEHSAYHHGEQSLAMAIINMAQTFVGSNNINMLVPSGQFGTRLQGGADAASPRYIFTFLNSVTRGIFNECDDPLLKYLDDDGQSIEPEWYMPILPTVLINGGHGIGTGWSTDVPSYNPREIVDNLKRMMNHEVMEPMHPWFRGFKGQIELNVSKKGEVSYAISGILGKVNETTIQITELPVGKWTQQYKEFLESMLDTDGGKKEPFIKGYKEFHTDTTVHFEITMSEKSMKEAEEVGLYKKFQLQRNLSISNMHLFNAEGQIVKYDNPEQIMREFYDLRLDYYGKRKDYMVGDLERQLSVLDNKCRFIKEVVAGTLKISNRKKADIVADLKTRGYAPQVKEAKKKAAGDAEEDEEEGEEQARTGITSYDYLLNMPIMSLTLERVKTLQADRDDKDAELGALKCKSPADLWTADLDQFLLDYEAYEADEERKASNQGPKAKGKKGLGKAQLKKKAASKRRKSWGASDMSESESDGDLFDDDDDDSDDEFVASKAKKKKPAAAKQAAKRPREEGPATTVTWIPPPKATIHAPVAKKEPAVKKQDTKDTPDKTAFKTTKINDDSDSDQGGASLFERLNAKVGGGEGKKLFNASGVGAAQKPKAAAKKKTKKASSDEESECSDEDFGGNKARKAPARKPAASKTAGKKTARGDDDDDFSDALLALEDDDYAPKAAKQPRRAAASKAAKYVVDDSDEEEESSAEESECSDFEPSPEKEKIPKKAKASSKAGAKKKAAAHSSDDDVEPAHEQPAADDDAAPVKKATAVRKTYGKAPAPVLPPSTVSVFAFDDDAAPAARKPAAKKPAAAPKAAAKKAPAKKKKADSSEDDEFQLDSDGDDNSAAVPAPSSRAAPRRAAAAAASKNVKKYADGSSDDDSEVALMDEDSDDEFEG